MLIHLHVGSDKAGSPVIQHHVHLNRQWFAEDGLYIPHRGLSSLGHQDPFPELPPRKSSVFRDKIAKVQDWGFDRIFISRVGICHLSEAELAAFRADVSKTKCAPGGAKQQV